MSSNHRQESRCDLTKPMSRHIGTPQSITQVHKTQPQRTTCFSHTARYEDSIVLGHGKACTSLPALLSSPQSRLSILSCLDNMGSLRASNHRSLVPAAISSDAPYPLPRRCPRVALSAATCHTFTSRILPRRIQVAGRSFPMQPPGVALMPHSHGSCGCPSR